MVEMQSRFIPTQVIRLKEKMSAQFHHSKVQQFKVWNIYYEQGRLYPFGREFDFLQCVQVTIEESLPWACKRPLGLRLPLIQARLWILFSKTFQISNTEKSHYGQEKKITDLTAHKYFKQLPYPPATLSFSTAPKLGAGVVVLLVEFAPVPLSTRFSTLDSSFPMRCKILSNKTASVFFKSTNENEKLNCLIMQFTLSDRIKK